MQRERYIMNRLREHYKYLLENYDYKVIYLALQGSQNYELDVYDDEYKSDIDTKAIIVPTLEDIAKNKKPVSETIVLPNNEHIDVKDIRVMFDTFKKQNVNYIEILFTDYYILNAEYGEYIEDLLKSAELIAHLNYNQALKCMAGMSMEKLKALQHPYPTIVDKIKKYGYDPKQLHHILRMNDFIKKYVSGKPYKECLIPDDKEVLIEIKKGKICCGDAVEIANEFDKETHEIMQENLIDGDTIDKDAIEILDNIKYSIIRKSLKEELSK